MTTFNYKKKKQLVICFFVYFHRLKLRLDGLGERDEEVDGVDAFEIVLTGRSRNVFL